MEVFNGRRYFMVVCCCLLGLYGWAASVQDRPGNKLMTRWERLLAAPLNEKGFRAACSLIDQQGEYDALVAMKYTNQLINRVRRTNNRQWMHALLTNKYELAQLVYPFLDSVETLAGELRNNAGNYRDHIFREAIVYSAHAYIQLDNADSAKKFIENGMQACRETRDSLNLAMLYMFNGELLFRKKTEKSTHALASVQKAKEISAHLTNKTPYFASTYLAAHIEYVNNPAKLVEALERLIPLSKDSSLVKKSFYKQTFFSFAKPQFTIYLDLMRLNLVLMDIPNARRMYELIEATLIARKRKTGILNDRSLGMLVSDRAVIEAFAGDSQLTAKLLDSCRTYFSGVAEADIPSVNYFLARALLNEMKGQYSTMLKSLEILKSKYLGAAVLPLPLATLFAHAYACNGDDERARLYFDRALDGLASREYSAAGYYHYQYYATWLYKKGEYLAYADALKKFYSVKDSIAGIQQRRNMEDVQAKRYVEERDLEIAYLRKIQEADRKISRLIWASGLIVLAALSAAIGILYSRNLQRRKNNLTLQEKKQRIETLVRELHHRVKNNLQVIGSLLSLQSLKLADGEAKQALADGQRRVESMALIHRKLYRHEDIMGVNMKDYVNDLIQHLIDSYGTLDIELKKEVDDVLMDIDTSVSLGLIINELVTNSLKYGLEKREDCRLYIGFFDRADDYRLVVADNGVGLPDGFDIVKSPSFGLRLVAKLVHQLRATIRWKGNAGAAFELIIPK